MSQSLQACTKQPEYTKASIKAALRSKVGRNIVWCVVEGKNDVRVYEKFFDSKKVKIKISEDSKGKTGWKKVGPIVNELTAEEPKCHIFGICDCEYSRYDSSFVCPQNVHLTDHRDIDMMMLEASSVNKGLSGWNSKFPTNIKKCVDPAIYFGYLRIYNQLNGFNCDFRDRVKTAPVWDFGTHSLYEDWRLRILVKFLDQTSDKGASEEDFNNFVEEKQLSGESWLDVCCGHDFLSILGYMMVKDEYNSEDKIRPRMIESYSYEDFKTTNLYKSIKQWSDDKGVSVLA